MQGEEDPFQGVLLLLLTLSYNNINDFAGDAYLLDNCLAFEERFHSVVGFDESYRVFLRGSRGDLLGEFELAGDLDRYLDYVVDSLRLVILGPLRDGAECVVSEERPELLREMRSERAQNAG